MILIADSGSTKTEWCVIDTEHEPKSFQTIGFNPYFVTEEVIAEELDKNLLPFVNTKFIEKVFFYGSGCSTPEKNQIIQSPLEDFFRNATVEVEHDLDGAARSLCGRQKGIACILGTGSNSCLYDGKDVVENVSSVGYMFGDEGGGVYAGKMFISDYLRDEMPADIRKLYEEMYPYRFDKILNAVYKEPFANRFLASFTPFMSKYIEHPYVINLMTDSFDKFFKYQVSHYTGYKELPVNATGSIAYYFSDILKQVAANWGVKLGKIIRTPMEGLIEYHK